MLYYKVVRNDGGNFYSGYTLGGFRLQYVRGTPAEAPTGKVFIFSDLASAQAFMSATPGPLEAWTCEAKGVEQVEAVLPQSVVLATDKVSVETVHAFWDKKMWKSGDPSRVKPEFASYHAQRTVRVSLIRPPEGTFLADEVTLKDKVV